MGKSSKDKKVGSGGSQNVGLDLSGVTSGPTTARRATAPLPSFNSATLYCSFCGKSQHEVRKLIAGPTVFICDECSDICHEIIIEEEREQTSSLPNGSSRTVLSVKLPGRLDSQELATLPSLISEVERAFPQCSIRITKYTPLSENDVVQLSVESPPAYDPAELAKQVRELTVKLRIEQQRYLSEKAERERLEEKLTGLMHDVFPLLVENLKRSGDYPGSKIQAMSIMFIDVSGFSTMDEEDRIRAIDLLRSLGRAILKSERGMYLNTWGDAVVAAFDDPASALRCGCKFAQHFNLVGLDARVGISWGTIRISVNEIKGTYDIDGAAVNLGARIESLAEPGTVLCTEEMGELVGRENEEFVFTPKTLHLKKNVGNLKEGDGMELLEVRSKLN